VDLNKKKITIIGFGRSGAGIASLAIQLGGIVQVSECASKQKVSDSIFQANLGIDIDFESDGHSESFIKNSDFVILSPGVRFDSQSVKWAKEENISCFSEIEFASMFCKGLIVAITGSNGKTTVSTLIDQMLRAGGKKTCLCGNIGSAFSKHVLSLSEDQIVVLEVSSFQLESIKNFHPHIAVLLNCTQNHLDRHRDMDEYFEAKSKIFLNQNRNDYAVINFDDDRIKNNVSNIKSKVVYFNGPDNLKKYSKENPNFLAARGVAHLFEIEDEVVDQAIKDFKGVEHRLERVRCIDDIVFINDSKATTAEAGRWALERADRPVVMICGGRDKNIDFKVLKNIVKEKVRVMVVIGESREKIKDAFCDIIDVQMEDDLEKAVLRAKEFSSKGDCVLFSPMCTSFDMFKNFEERGKVFKNIVEKL